MAVTPREVLLRCARSQVAGGAVRAVFAHMPWLVPLRRVATSPTALALRHPRPSAPGHALVVPKRGILGLDDLEARFGRWVEGMVALALEVAAARGPEWGLVVNGGRWQDVRLLHGHVLPLSAVGLNAARAHLSPDRGYALVVEQNGLVHVIAGRRRDAQGQPDTA